jgi:hypothetical protein
MAIGIAPYRPATRPKDAGNRYSRIWGTAALLAAAGWVSIALLQTPRLPLLTLAVGLGAVGGVLFLRVPTRTRTGRSRYLAGAGLVAGVVLVTVGVGHHLEAGLATIVLVAGSAPPVLRWVAGR